MKQHILNFILVLVIAIGGVYLMQPTVAQAQGQACPVEEGEDACVQCLDDCVEGGVGCGLLQEQGECQEDPDDDDECEWISCKDDEG